MGGCVVPPGTAAMCQTGGEEEKGSEWAGATEGGREREGRRRKREKNVWGGWSHCLAVLQLSVNNTQEPLVGIRCLPVQLWQDADD